MPHRQGETFVTAFSAPAGATTERTIHEVEAGRSLSVYKVELRIATAAPLSVTAATFLGESRLAPQNGPVAGGGEPYMLDASGTVGPTGEITLRVVNGDTAAHDVQALVYTGYNSLEEDDDI